MLNKQDIIASFTATESQLVEKYKEAVMNRVRARANLRLAERNYREGTGPLNEVEGRYGLLFGCENSVQEAFQAIVEHFDKDQQDIIARWFCP